MTDLTAPGTPADDNEDGVLEGALGTVTDEEWRTAHEALAAAVDWPDAELAHVWDPSLPGSALVDPHEVDEAPDDPEVGRG
jgi:hypothetical protein